MVEAPPAPDTQTIPPATPENTIPPAHPLDEIPPATNEGPRPASHTPLDTIASAADLQEAHDQINAQKAETGNTNYFNEEHRARVEAFNQRMDEELQKEEQDPHLDPKVKELSAEFKGKMKDEYKKNSGMLIKKGEQAVEKIKNHGLTQQELQDKEQSLMHELDALNEDKNMPPDERAYKINEVRLQLAQTQESMKQSTATTDTHSDEEEKKSLKKTFKDFSNGIVSLDKKTWVKALKDVLLVFPFVKAMIKRSLKRR